MIICLLAIGVDLGTTFSVVGININKKVTMIEDDAGVLFPSVVSYLDTGGKIAILLKLYINNFDIEILVGREATARLESNPANTIFNSKRYIGRR
jgi:molecular chaperone DnaK (HSP70)